MERIPLAVTLLMAGDHLVLVGLRLANSLGLQVAKFLCHFLKLKFADRARKVVELEVISMMANVGERKVAKPTRRHTGQDKNLEVKVNTSIHT